MEILSKLSYIDTICLVLPRLMPPERFAQLRDSLADDLRPPNGRVVRKKMHRSDGTWFYALYVHQPSLKAMQLLASSGTPLRITEVHVALDLLTGSMHDAERLQDYVQHRLIPGRTASERSTVVRTTTYFRKEARRGVVTVLYWDRKSKAVPSANCLHLESRIMGASALRAAGLARPEDLLHMDHRQFWTSRLRLRSPPLAGRLQELVKRWLPKGALDDAAKRYVRRHSSIALRVAKSSCDQVISADLLWYLNLHPKVFGAKPSRHFGRESSEWMLPERSGNALWRPLERKG